MRHRLQKAPETIDPFIADIESKNKSIKNKKRIAYGLAASAAVLGGLIGLNTDIQDKAESASITPSPTVMTSGSELLISANNSLRDFGPSALGIGAAGFAAYEITRRRRPDSTLAEKHENTHQTNHKKAIIFTGTAMGLVAAASGLGDAASKGANEPVAAIASLTGSNMETTPVVTQYDSVPYNYSEVDYPATKYIIEGLGGQAVPFVQTLGDVKDPHASSNPSSAPILALPNNVLKVSLGADMPPVEDCNDASIIVGEQLGVEKGDTVLVNGKETKVTKTIDSKPGLDRVAAITSLEQLQECVYPNLPISGVLAKGLDGKKDLLQAAIADTNSTDSSRTLQEFADKYTEFWEKSVKPPQMILILALTGFSAMAIAGDQINVINRRRRHIAMLRTQGVSPEAISSAYSLANQRDTLLATSVAAPVGLAMTSIYNSSQFGLETPMNLSSLGAGYLALAAVTAGASQISKRTIKKINPAEELRSGV